MKQVKVDKMMLYGKIDGKFQEGEYIQFDTPLTISGGRINSNDDGNVLITFDTLKENIYGHDITPKVNFNTNDELMDEPSEMISHKDIDDRVPNDEEYNVLNEYLKKDYTKLELSDYEDIKRHRVTVYDINEDFKILNHSECTIYQWDDGKETVNWETYRYAYKHGLIYPYESNENYDHCQEDISGLFKKK